MQDTSEQQIFFQKNIRQYEVIYMQCIYMFFLRKTQVNIKCPFI